MAKTRARARKRKNPSDSALPAIGAGLAGLGLLWLGRRLFSGPPAPAVVHVPVQVPQRPQLPAGPPAMSGGMTVDRNGILTVPLPEESAARSRSVRRAPPPPPPPAPSARNTDEGLERDADHGGQHEDSGEEGSGRLGGEKF